MGTGAGGGREEDRGKLVGFLQEGGNFLFGEHSVFGDDLELVRALVGFLQDDAELGEELGSRTSAARRPVVCSDGQGAACQLMADDLPRCVAFDAAD